jgi:hypothetical protein
MAKSDYDETKAVAHLPNLDVEILHRSPWHGEEELLSITLRAVPSFETFFHFVQATNPMLLWMRALETAWSPWLRLGEARRPPQIGGDA